MIQKQEHNGNIKVEEYSLDTWLAQIEEVINQGYCFDFSTNENYPQGFGSLYTAVLVPNKVQKAQDAQDAPPESTESAAPSATEIKLIDEPIKVDGRKKK